ncbi:MAG: transposase [Paludisphaera borealis]|uniref:transposase n=1 Tax=Paludisphaera borealis TaxID=1387353 RepID=UPI0028450C79|nr:transposase [Paludisphaera borealis]MDR3617851.1 transposase [Paludisphaera borealis]
MGRPLRAAEGGIVYHVLNRANARMRIFDDDGDYEAFLRILEQAVVVREMRLLAYCLMPNHFHLLLWPRADGDLSSFMRWLTLTHTQRWHAHRRSTGTGHLYQGRFKSFPVQSDEYFLAACRYVERNALRAGLVPRAEHWPWGSLARFSADARSGPEPPLSPWPVPRPPDWLDRVNAVMTPQEEDALQHCIRRGRPFGSEPWRKATSTRLGLDSPLKPLGRPRKPKNGA